MYMPARLTDFIEVNKNNYNYVYNIITSKDRFTEQGQLFIAEIKGHIDDRYINEFRKFICDRLGAERSGAPNSRIMNLQFSDTPFQ